MKKQKYFRGHRVLVDHEMPDCMSHFEKGFEAIVIGSYSDKYGGQDVDKYSLCVLNNDDEPINRTSWYHEDQLILIDKDRDKGEQILQAYKQGYVSPLTFVEIDVEDNDDNA